MGKLLTTLPLSGKRKLIADKAKIDAVPVALRRLTACTVFVKTGCSRYRNLWAHLCAVLELIPVPADKIGDEAPSGIPLGEMERLNQLAANPHLTDEEWQRAVDSAIARGQKAQQEQMEESADHAAVTAYWLSYVPNVLLDGLFSEFPDLFARAPEFRRLSIPRNGAGTGELTGRERTPKHLRRQSSARRSADNQERVI